MDKNLKFAVIFIAIFVFTILIKNSVEGMNHHRYDWDACPGFLKEGTLYEGQPLCEQGPIFIYFLAIFQSIFGTDGYYDSVIYLVGSLLLAYIFFMASELGKFRKEDYAIFGFFYLIFIVYFVGIEIPHILGIAFFLTGYYYANKNKWIAGTFFALSVYSQMLYIVAVGIFILFKTFKIKDKKIDINFKKGLVLSAPLIIMTALYFLIYPNIFYYLILNAATTQKHTFAEFLTATSIYYKTIFISQFYRKIRTVFLVLVGGYMLMAKKDDLSPVLFFFPIVMFYSTFSRMFHEMLRYVMLPYVLYIIILARNVNLKRHFRIPLFLLLTLPILYMPWFLANGTIENYNEKLLVEKPFEFISDYNILSEAEYPSVIKERTDLKNIEIITPGWRIDEVAGPGFHNSGFITNLTEWQDYFDGEGIRRNKLMLEKDYDVIIAMPGSKVLRSYVAGIANTTCTAIMPVLTHWSRADHIFYAIKEDRVFDSYSALVNFKDANACHFFKTGMIKHNKEVVYPYYCSKNPDFARIIRYIISFNGIDLGECII